MRYGFFPLLVLTLYSFHTNAANLNWTHDDKKLRLEEMKDEECKMEDIEGIREVLEHDESNKNFLQKLIKIING